MVRKITFAVGLVMSLLATRAASAVPITPVDLDSRAVGSLVASHFALFGAAPGVTVGQISSEVFFGAHQYTYVHTVTPHRSPDFPGGGASLYAPFHVDFNGIAGWSFSDARRAGGAGTDADGSVHALPSLSDAQLEWDLDFTGSGDRRSGWEAFEPIRFFFVSTHPPLPFTREYWLSQPFPVFVGRTQTLAPVPEPGSLALLGSGLVGLYAAMRRRQRAKG